MKSKTMQTHISFIFKNVFHYFNFISLNFELFLSHGRRMRKIREGEKIRSTPIRESVGISRRNVDANKHF
jgi:hypothetical protein